MQTGRIGGALMVGGWVMLAVSIPLSYVTDTTVSGTAGTLAALLMAAGAGVIAIAGPGPLRGRAARVGLGIMAVGLVGMAGSSIAAAGLVNDPLEDIPYIVLLFGGGLLMVVGMVVTQLSLLVAGGLGRRLAALFFAGAAAGYLASALAIAVGPGPAQLLAEALAVVGVAAFLVGGAGPGVLVLLEDRATHVLEPRPT